VWETGEGDWADQGTMEIFFEDSSTELIVLTHPGPSGARVFFGVIADTFINRIRWHEPYEPDSGAIEETALDNFAVPVGGSISGFVRNSAGYVITDALISVHAHGVTPGSSSLGTYASQTDGIGRYTITGLAPGTYKVEANNNLEPEYVRKYYDDQYTWDSAYTVDVQNNEVPGIDFILEPAGSIRGRVIDENLNPISGLALQIWGEKCWNNWDWRADGWTDDEGYYEVLSLLPGDYYIRACPDCNGQNYLTTWWTASGGVGDWRGGLG
jgi:hypothetical protein